MRNIYLSIICFLCHCVTAQIKDNFDDGNLSINPTWLGDVVNFKVDDTKSLRLNAPDAGQSFLYLSTILPDSFVFEIDAKLEFSPSGSNLTKIYIMLDKIDLSTANGYFIGIGENGSADAVRVYKSSNGVASLMGSGKEGAMSTDPSAAKMRVTYTRGGFFNVQMDYDGNSVYEDNFTFFDNEIKSGQSNFFGIQCLYSATRKDKFVYDNFEIKEIVKDIKAPVLQLVEVLNDKQLSLQFDETLEELSAGNVLNYTVTNLGNPNLAKIDVSNPATILLTFNQGFSSGTTYTINISNIKDLFNNILANASSTFQYIGAPNLGDIVISEILFDPYVNQQDFIELYNPTDKSIELKGIKIKNFSNGQEKVFNQNYLLKAKSYLGITSDVSGVTNTYSPSTNATIVMNDLPAFNNDMGNISILLPDNTILDSFNYNVKYHLLINDTKSVEGISLEKILLQNFNNDRANWHSAAKAVKYATPGYANSNNLDNVKPTLLNYQLFDDDKLILTFDDVLTKSSAENVKNYFGNQGLGNPVFANFLDLKTNTVVIEFAQVFEANKTYEIEINNVLDKNNNAIEPTKFEFGFGLDPVKGEVIISEILFNPYSDGADFVELYNTSDKAVQLQGLIIKNKDNQQEKPIVDYYVLKAQAQVAISTNINAQKTIYETPDTARFIQNLLPAFNADKGNVMIINAKGIVLDSFDYNESMHQLLFDKSDVKGVSLEKIQLTAFNNNKSNWHSAAKSGNYASPGYINSNSVVINNTTEVFFINKKSFSPNGDGNDDLLVVGYNIESPGYIANIEVYSSEGYKVKNLAKNELLGTSGIITWDGTNEDGNVERIGIYILKGSIFNTNGEVKYFKKECVLADFID